MPTKLPPWKGPPVGSIGPPGGGKPGGGGTGKGGHHHGSQHGPPPLPKGNEIRLTYDHEALYLPLGDGPVRISDGYGGWTTVDRPRDTPITRWESQPALRLLVPIMLDGWSENRGVERILDKLLWFGRRPGGDKEPRPFRIKGERVPFSGDGKQWVIENTPDFANEIRSRQNGNLMRQSLVMQLLMYEPGDRPKFTRRKASKDDGGKGPGHSVTVKQGGETLRQIAARLKPDADAQGVSEYARAIGKLNGIEDIRQKLRAGRELRLP